MAAAGGAGPSRHSTRLPRVAPAHQSFGRVHRGYLLLVVLLLAPWRSATVAAADEGTCQLLDKNGKVLDDSQKSCSTCQDACLKSDQCDVMLWDDVTKSKASLPKYRCDDTAAANPSSSALCVLLDQGGDEIDVSRKDCQGCSLACSTSTKCHTLVWDTQEFKKSATSTCQPIPFFEEFYSVENTQAWIQSAQDEPEEYFQMWMDVYEKQYEDGEVQAEAQQVWKDNLDYIYSANDALGLGLVPNDLADITLEEAARQKAGLPGDTPETVYDAVSQSTGRRRRMQEPTPFDPGHRLLQSLVTIPASPLPDFPIRPNGSAAPALPGMPASFDWRNFGLPIQVRDQGKCNSCYAFATTAHFEMLLWMTAGLDTDLSEQDILDCCSEATCWNGNTGGCANPQTCGPCNNGWPHAAMEWSVESGLATESSSKYTPNTYLPWDLVLPMDKLSCPARSGVQQVSQYIDFDMAMDMKFGSLLEEDVIKLLLQRPVVVGINMQDDNFRFLGPSHTVIYPSRPLTGINHAVVLVGYGTHPQGGPYWLIQNSWGVNWGDRGLARVARSVDDPWNVLQYAAAAILKSGSRCLAANCKECESGAIGYLNCKACKPGFDVSTNGVFATCVEGADVKASSRSPNRSPSWSPSQAPSQAPAPALAPTPELSLNDTLDLFAPAPTPALPTHPGPASGPTAGLWGPPEAPEGPPLGPQGTPAPAPALIPRPGPAAAPATFSPLRRSPSPANPAKASSPRWSPSPASPAKPSPSASPAKAAAAGTNYVLNPFPRPLGGASVPAMAPAQAPMPSTLGGSNDGTVGDGLTDNTRWAN